MCFLLSLELLEAKQFDNILYHCCITLKNEVAANVTKSIPEVIECSIVFFGTISQTQCARYWGPKTHAQVQFEKLCIFSQRILLTVTIIFRQLNGWPSHKLA